nr:MAG TPA: hypothetical protein [Caudoviricetes sp.]
MHERVLGFINQRATEQISNKRWLHNWLPTFGFQWL